MIITQLSPKLILLTVALSLFSCKKDSPVEDLPKGDFVINLTNAPQSKTFFDGEAQGEDCERLIFNGVLFIFETGSNTLLRYQLFSDTELAKVNPHIVVSFPEGTLSTSKTYDFFVLANHELAENEISAITRTRLLEIEYSDIDKYNADDFTKIFTDQGVKALRPRGFAMGGSNLSITPSGDKNKPTKVEIKVSRNAAKLEIKAYTTQKFDDTYRNTFGSTIKLKSVTLKNIPSNSYAFEKITNENPKSYVNSILQTPLSVNGGNPNVGVDDKYSYQSIFYMFQNGIVGASAVEKKPVVVVEAEYDFDGKENSIPTDVSQITYEVELDGVASKIGLVNRNTYLKLELQISGLTSNEVVANFKINDWNTVNVQSVEIGS